MVCADQPIHQPNGGPCRIDLSRQRGYYTGGEPVRDVVAAGEVLVTARDENLFTSDRPAQRVTFSQDFKQFFLRGLAEILPTLITLWLVLWAWNFLWESVGRYVVTSVKWLWPDSYLATHLDYNDFATRVFGVAASVGLVYIVGFFVGNLIGRTFWRLGERLVLRIPFIRAIYPAVKQVTDFVLTERKQQFQSSRVVAIQPHERGIWSIGLVTGPGLPPLAEATGQEMVTVFVPSTPTAFTGYVLVVPRVGVVELPLSVEEAMRLLVSGGVIGPAGGAELGGRVINLPSKMQQDAAMSPNRGPDEAAA